MPQIGDSGVNFQVGQGLFSGAGAAVSDLFAADADRTRARGSRMQADLYGQSSALATENEQYTERSTAIQEMQQQRKNYLALGGTEAAVAGSGFAMSGSGLDILRSSAEQAALSKAVIQQQGYITEAGYQEQASAYKQMQSASLLEAQAQEHAATGATWSAGIKGAGAVASLFSPMPGA